METWGHPGQEWSGGGAGVACESLNPVESKGDGDEADCCFWLQQ